LGGQVCSRSKGNKFVSNVLAGIQEAFHHAFGVDGQVVSLETKPEDIKGWDSLGHVNLTSCLEKVFDISLDIDDMMEMENVRQVAKVIERKLGLNSPEPGNA
jgi:acyl carrier protein